MKGEKKKERLLPTGLRGYTPGPEIKSNIISLANK